MPPDFLPAGLVAAGLALLLDALDCARDTGSPLWDFAVEIAFLRDAGITLTALRWLVAKDLATHGREISLAGETKRSFRKLKTFHFGKRSCLMLTDAGAAFARSVCTDSGLQAVPQVSMLQPDCVRPAEPVVKPRWSGASRRLLVGDCAARLSVAESAAVRGVCTRTIGRLRHEGLLQLRQIHADEMRRQS